MKKTIIKSIIYSMGLLGTTLIIQGAEHVFDKEVEEEVVVTSAIAPLRLTIGSLTISQTKMTNLCYTLENINAAVYLVKEYTEEKADELYNYVEEEIYANETVKKEKVKKIIELCYSLLGHIKRSNQALLDAFPEEGNLYVLKIMLEATLKQIPAYSPIVELLDELNETECYASNLILHLQSSFP